MRTTREQVYSALFALVSQAKGVNTTARRTAIYTNIPPEQQPALFQEQVGENPINQGRGLPYVWELEVVLGVYAYCADETVAPDTLLNPILDSIEAILPPNTVLGPQTLGGLVYECRLVGNAKAFSGSLGNQAFAYIPIRIKTVNLQTPVF